MTIVRSSDRGQTMAEYAVMLGVITALVVLALQLLGGVVATGISNAASLV
jgi:Flp pilus assembly pilin Flp